MFVKDKKVLISRKGEILKEIHCPENLRPEDLKNDNLPGSSLCLKCSKRIIDTDFLTETELEKALKQDPDICLKLNLVNPIFEVI